MAGEHAKDVKILTRHWDDPKQKELATYRSRGGYEALRKALSMEPAAVIEEVKASGLRGRGGAGFPTGTKWSFIPKGATAPRYLCCNADEGEPGTFKDRDVMRYDPHALVEGMGICCWAVGAHHGFVYIRGEFVAEARVVQAAIDEAYAAGILGPKAMGTDFALDLTVHRGAGAYICGEETALIESIEGRKGQPRLKPPFPATVGLFDGPTVVNNVETLAALPWILSNGAKAYAAFGTEKSKGTKLFSISGPVKKPGVYEVEMGFPLRRFIDEVAGGLVDGKELKGVIPGGSSTPVLLPDEVDRANLDHESLAALGSMLGSGAIIVLPTDFCVVRAMAILARFYHHESCGQCTPCREGTGWLDRVISRLEHGKGTVDDIDFLASEADAIIGTTICPLADAAAMPMKSFVTKFRADFEEHLRLGRCPMGE
jgi:NADH-quinone oxidoreductase subunit F